MTRRTLLRVVFVVVALAYLAVRLSTGIVVAALDTPFDAHDGDAVELTIPAGSSARQVADLLEKEGVVRSGRDLRLWMRYEGTAGQIHTGQYRFLGPATVREIAEIIVEGRVLLAAVTVLEGATRWEVAEALSGAGFGVYEEAWAATGDVSLIRDLDPEATDLEGYLFPDTYHAHRDATAAEIVDMMVDQFRRVWTQEHARKAKERGLSLREVVTIASLVEAETGRVAERELVSGVYHNRLEIPMLLQCDPTLLYALRLDGRTDRNIRRADFTNESPYNTYRFPGLPPGPIGNPGLASIDAALAPAETEFLYFVGRNDGSHAFSRTLREHNANVNRYQR